MSTVCFSNNKANCHFINFIYSSIISHFLFVSTKPLDVATTLSSTVVALCVACLTSSWSLSNSWYGSCVGRIAPDNVKGWVKDYTPWWMLAPSAIKSTCTLPSNNIFQAFNPCCYCRFCRTIKFLIQHTLHICFLFNHNIWKSVRIV